MQHPFPFDPTYGYTLENLLQVAAPPEVGDYTAFWRDTYAQTMAVAPKPDRREITRPSDVHRIFEIEYTGLGDFRVGGWLTFPRDGKPTHGIVASHGYGGREGPDGEPQLKSAAILYPCGRGFHRSARPNLPSTSPFHVLHGITSRDTYIHRFCIADLWSARLALLELVPGLVGRPIDIMGTSFGGGVCTQAVAWEKNFRRALIGEPSFSNHPLRVTMQCVGSGEAVRLYYQRHPQVLDVLAYFDSSVAARHITAPTLFICSVFDPAVPPPGQFSAFNACPATKKLLTEEAGHFDFPGAAAQGARNFRERRDWILAENLS